MNGYCNSLLIDSHSHSVKQMRKNYPYSNSYYPVSVPTSFYAGCAHQK